MNKLHWIFKQYMAPEGDDGSSNGGAPAPEPETNDGGGVDWEALSEGVEPGADEGGGSSEVVLDDPLPEGALSPDPEGNPDPDATTQEPKPVETAPVETPVAKTPEEAAAEQEALATRFKEWQQSETERLTKEYAFDEDTAARLQTEPELVLPELAAKMQMNMTQQIVEIVQRMMPSMVQPVIASNTSEAKATDFFREHNPDIDLGKHRDAVIEAGKAFRKLNPKATPEQAAKGIGQIVRVSMGLATPPPAPKTKAGPHRPVAAGAKTAPAAKPASGNKWADLAEDD